ncbi:hypothetical protein ACTU6V_10655 [Microbacterium sp. A204]|uniref:hypothetical protein n=1 Tax=Microbacterium sp. A204 TaxID=3457321 RepID=UPI003FD20A56
MERRSYGIRARARWTDPLTKQRVIRTEIVKDEATARAFFETLRNSSVKGMDVSMTLLEFFTSIDDRWARGLDMTLHRRQLPVWSSATSTPDAWPSARHAIHRWNDRPHDR